MENITSLQIKNALERAKVDRGYGAELQKRLETGKYDSQLSELGIVRSPQGLKRISSDTQKPVTEPSFTETTVSDIQQRGQNIADIQQQREQGKSATMEALKMVSPELAAKVEPALSVAQKIKSKLGVGLDIAKTGQVAGAVNDVLGNVLMSIPGVKQVGSIVGKEISKVVPDVLAKAGIQTMEQYNAFAEQNPLIAKNLEGVVNIASLLPTGKAATITTEGVEQAGKQVAKTANEVAGQFGNKVNKVKNIASNIIPTQEQTILDIVTPELSAKKTGQAIKSGRGKVDSGTIFDTVSITPDSKINKAFEATKDIIDPNATITENTNIVRNALSTEAEALKNKIKDVPAIFTFKELNSALNKIDLPISFKEDAQAKVLKKVTDAAMKISKEQKGKLGGLLDARKEFDRLVEENFPNLYEVGKPTPTYNAITKTRNALNDFIESKLPDGFGYKESLRKQTSFYDALDAMESKAAKEVGAPTNKYVRKVQQIMKNNPKTTRALKYGASGTAVLGGAKAILGD